MAASVPVVAAASIDQRFAQLIQQFGLTKNSFAISLGKTASVVQHLIDGRNKPGFDLMCKVFEVYPNVSRDWLLLGRGPMLVGSSGLSGPAVAAAQPAALEPDFEPIDLADVAPRATRRPAVSQLQPEEIDAALALALAATVQVQPAVAVPTPAISATVRPTPEGDAATLPAMPAPMPEAASAVPAAPLATPVSAVGPRPARPFRPVVRPATVVAASATTAPLNMQENSGPAPAPVVAPIAPLSASYPIAPPAVGSDAYVSAAIHAQHLQHQLALAELRNQHLLEQQQMLREMLAMARQSMV